MGTKINEVEKSLFILDNKLENGYREYLKEPLAELGFRGIKSIIYEKGWVTRLGRGIVDPDPHTHYAYGEFCFRCGKDKEFFDKYCK